MKSWRRWARRPRAPLWCTARAQVAVRLAKANTRCTDTCKAAFFHQERRVGRREKQSSTFLRRLMSMASRQSSATATSSWLGESARSCSSARYRCA